MGYLIAAIIGFFFLSRSGGLGGLLGPSNSSQQGPPPAIPVSPQPIYTTGFTMQQAGSAIGGINTALGTASSFLKAGSSLAKAIPIVGGIVDSLVSYFSAASQKRAGEARNENQAVANAIPGWDAYINAVADYYNRGQLTAQQAIQMWENAMANYFAEVSPQIQPDRNGCNSGMISKQDADSQYPGMKQCSGSWGAACCVGYADLWNGVMSLEYAVGQTENTGKPSPAIIPAVLASKYGGVNRSAYTITLTRPTSVFGF